MGHRERSWPPGPALPAGSVRSFGPGAWCWFQDPRAVQVGGRLGRTYAGWIAQNGDITVGAFDLRSGRRLAHVVGHWIHDEHASASLVVEPNRRLSVFWAVHNGGSVHYRHHAAPARHPVLGPGHRWASHFLSYAGPTISPGGPEVYYSGGLALDHSDPSVVYVSRKAGRWFRLERWQTSDGGAHWRHAVVAARPGDQVRPVVPRGAGGGPISVLWMSGHYGYSIHYDTSISFQVR